MVIMPPLPLERTVDSQADIQRHLELQSRVIEAWVRAEPAQWLWLHRRWKNQFPEIYRN
jgi:KDO2-lipid IV(A) lauroyltransferase